MKLGVNIANQQKANEKNMPQYLGQNISTILQALLGILFEQWESLANDLVGPVSTAIAIMRRIPSQNKKESLTQLYNTISTCRNNIKLIIQKRRNINEEKAIHQLPQPKPYNESFQYEIAQKYLEKANEYKQKAKALINFGIYKPFINLFDNDNSDIDENYVHKLENQSQTKKKRKVSKRHIPSPDDYSFDSQKFYEEEEEEEEEEVNPLDSNIPSFQDYLSHQVEDNTKQNHIKQTSNQEAQTSKLNENVSPENQTTSKPVSSPKTIEHPNIIPMLPNPNINTNNVSNNSILRNININTSRNQTNSKTPNNISKQGVHAQIKAQAPPFSYKQAQLDMVTSAFPRNAPMSLKSNNQNTSKQFNQGTHTLVYGSGHITQQVIPPTSKDIKLVHVPVIPEDNSHGSSKLTESTQKQPSTPSEELISNVKTESSQNTNKESTVQPDKSESPPPENVNTKSESSTSSSTEVEDISFRRQNSSQSQQSPIYITDSDSDLLDFTDSDDPDPEPNTQIICHTPNSTPVHPPSVPSISENLQSSSPFPKASQESPSLSDLSVSTSSENSKTTTPVKPDSSLDKPISALVAPKRSVPYTPKITKSTKTNGKTENVPRTVIDVPRLNPSLPIDTQTNNPNTSKSSGDTKQQKNKESNDDYNEIIEDDIL